MPILKLIIIVLMLFPSAAIAADYYVAQSGAGAANGSDCANAYSIATHNAGGAPFNALDGDTIYFCDTANFTTALNTPDGGTSGNEVTYTKAAGDTPKWFGVDDPWVIDVDYVIIGNLTYQGDSELDGTGTISGDYVEFHDNTITAVGEGLDLDGDYSYIHDCSFSLPQVRTTGESDFITISNTAQYWRIISNTFVDGVGEAYISNFGGDWGVIRANVFRNTGTNYYQQGMSTSDTYKVNDHITLQHTNSDFILFEDNLIYETSDNWGDGMGGTLIHSKNGSDHIIARHNIVYNFDGTMADPYSDGGDAPTYFYVYHNTWYSSTGYSAISGAVPTPFGWYELDSSPLGETSYHNAFNNIISERQFGYGIKFQSGADQEYNVFKNNILHNVLKATAPYENRGTATGGTTTTQLVASDENYASISGEITSHFVANYTNGFAEYCSSYTNSTTLQLGSVLPLLSSGDSVRVEANADLVWNGSTGYAVESFPGSLGTGNTFSGNFDSDPLFKDTGSLPTTAATASGLALGTGSPAINAAAFLTTVTAVNGNNITVVDAGFFFDAWSIPNEIADTLYDDDGVSSLITSINYSTNVITVSDSTGFTVDDEVTSVDYSGAAPDIGAFKYFGGAVLTGTAIAGGVLESEIVTGGETIIITLTNNEWVSTFGDDNAITTDFISGMDSDGAEAGGWDAQIKATLTHAAVVRDVDNVTATITLIAAAGYDIAANETVTITIPATSLTGGEEVVATPSFPISMEVKPPAVTGGITYSATGTSITYSATGASIQ